MGVFSFLFGLAAAVVLTWPYNGSDVGTTTAASELWATTLRSSPAVARAQYADFQPRVVPKVMQAPARTSFGRFSHVARGAAPVHSRIVVRSADIETEVKKMIAEQLSVDEAKVTNEAVELIMAVEEKFGVQIPEEEAEKMTTVQAV